MLRACFLPFFCVQHNCYRSVIAEFNLHLRTELPGFNFLEGIGPQDRNILLISIHRQRRFCRCYKTGSVAFFRIS